MLNTVHIIPLKCSYDTLLILRRTVLVSESASIFALYYACKYYTLRLYNME
jgi:hypothetical protein